MALFYFDIRDGDNFFADDTGVELAAIDQARDQATRALAGLAREILPGKLRREIAIEVRNAASVRILHASLWFEIAQFVSAEG